MRRFAERSATSTAAEHLIAAEMLQKAGGPSELAAMYDRLLDTLATRPAARIIKPVVGDIEATYRDVLAAVAVER